MRCLKSKDHVLGDFFVYKDSHMNLAIIDYLIHIILHSCELMNDLGYGQTLIGHSS